MVSKHDEPAFFDEGRYHSLIDAALLPGSADVRHFPERDLNEAGRAADAAREAAALTLLNFYFRIYAGTIKKEQVVDFLKALVRHLDQPLLIVWDRLPGHRSRLVQDYIASLRRINQDDQNVGKEHSLPEDLFSRFRPNVTLLH